MSYNGVGLSTPRGSGSSGYVQSNRFHANSKPAPAAASGDAAWSKAAEVKKPMAKGIAEHERKRRIESEVLVLSETLADQGYSEAEIAEKVGEARRVLEVESDAVAHQSDARRF